MRRLLEDIDNDVKSYVVRFSHVVQIEQRQVRGTQAAAEHMEDNTELLLLRVTLLLVLHDGMPVLRRVPAAGARARGRLVALLVLRGDDALQRQDGREQVSAVLPRPGGLLLLQRGGPDHPDAHPG